MSFGGFGKNSGPSPQPGAQTPFGNSPRHPSPSSPLPVLPRYVLFVLTYFLFSIRNVS